MDRLFNWLSGWRWDHDGFLVRARRATDPDMTALDRSDIGFVEEACIAVRSHKWARLVDAGRTLPTANAEDTQ